MPYALDIESWIESETVAAQREFRQAVHTVLLAIGRTPELSATMLVKGGILLAIRYRGARYTRDMDFSTDQQYQGFKEDEFVSTLEKALVDASARLEYDLDCRLQKCKNMLPHKPEAKFPSLQLTIGYAPKQHVRRHKRLLAKKASEVVKVDYSFNEITLETEEILLSDGETIQAYSFSDVVAEKFRAILQQEVRNRVRRQDAYDVYALLQEFPDVTAEEKGKILASLHSKSKSRGLAVTRESLQDPAIVKRSEAGYDTLEGEISGELPPFGLVYGTVEEFYQSLPWEQPG